MKKSLVVGFCGLAGSGKNEAANALHSDYWMHLAFADAIKDIARVRFGWDGKKDKRGRELLQDIGMIGRKYNSSIWLNRVADIISFLKIQKTLHNTNHTPAIEIGFAITDVRFPNEADFIKNELGGIIIRVNRPGQAIEKFHSHISENEQWKIKADYTILNNGSVAELQAKVLEIINGLNK